MKIGIAFDLAPGEPPPGAPDDLYEEFDKPSTIDALAEVFRGEGHDVSLLGDGPGLVRSLLEDPPEFVWNIAEGEGVGRGREARVPAVLELLGIPYSGSDPFTLAVALDKAATKRLVVGDDVLVPAGVCVPACSTTSVVRGLIDRGLRSGDYPVIVKPAFEGSSKGIRGKSLAYDASEAVRLVEELSGIYGQPILVETFIAGDEVTVGLIGNGATLEVLGVMRVLPVDSDPLFVYSLDVKRDWRRRVRYETPARFDQDLIDRVSSLARLVFDRLGCRDFARIDFRVRDGVPYFLEANPLPGLAPGTSDLVLLAEGYGVSHRALILRILQTSLDRVSLDRRESGLVERCST